MYALKSAAKIDDLKPYNFNNNIIYCEIKSDSLMENSSTKCNN